MKIDLENAIIHDGIIYVPDRQGSLDGHQCRHCDLARICACGDEYYCSLFDGYPLKQVGTVNPDALDLPLSK